ncbi:protein YibB [Helicobacter sp. MIT 11-5569]|uniref:WlaTC/HtrL family glycosyltransferase n=1 Tax=Helicobacter sp. MIT 11-5569 TaxID=1548151 RepID=UPI00068C85A9|nr:WlaTC/HtrL family glycosyltransferase [Helicobacter sp. MIT 11-5569]TLD82670.1 protein YibB [Helicobacter sp. MIT 11-5569]
MENIESMTIVTAFYDIKRENLDDFKRDYTRYYEYFAFWAGVKNPLIVYTTKEHEEAILKIRKAKGLESKTQVIIKPLESFDTSALEKIQKTFKDFDQTQGRKNPQNIECLSAEYCYLMYCKPYFVCDAIERGIVSRQVLWLDFGYNHGGKFYQDSKQFDFLLTPQKNIEHDKINFFSIKDNEKDSIAEIYFNMNVFLIGSLFSGNIQAWIALKEHFKKALEAFTSLNIFDDDQILLVWCYRNFPQNYHVIRTYEWFAALDNFIPKEICQALKRNLKESLPYRQAKAKYKEAFKKRNAAQCLYYGFLYVWYKIFKDRNAA